MSALCLLLFSQLPSAAVTFIVASPAFSLAMIKIGIEKVIRMAVSTVRLGSLLPGNILTTVTTAAILTPCYWFKMGRVHAASVAAKVVNIKSNGDRPNYQSISNTMGIGTMQTVIGTTDVKNSIPMDVMACLPWPALIWCSLVNLLPESFFYGSAHKEAVLSTDSPPTTVASRSWTALRLLYHRVV